MIKAMLLIIIIVEIIGASLVVLFFKGAHLNDFDFNKYEKDIEKNPK